MNVASIRSITILAALALLAVGCVGSPWEANYKALEHSGNQHLTPTQKVAIRTVEFERYKAFSADDAKRRAASDVAIEDETHAMKLERRGKLLQAFRVPEKPEDVMLLGSETFYQYMWLDPKDGQLEAFARKIGADYAAVSIGYLGRVNAVVYMPETTFSTRTDSATAYGAGGSATVYSQGTTASTTYQPMQTTEPLFEYDVIYVRKFRPGDPIPPTALAYRR